MPSSAFPKGDAQWRHDDVINRIASSAGAVSSPSSFHVVVRCRHINQREAHMGAQRFPYRKDLNYRCALVSNGDGHARSTLGDAAAGHVAHGYVSIFDPDSTAVLKQPPPPAGPTADCSNSHLAPSLQEGERRYHFHDVFGAGATNHDVFHVAVLPLVTSVLEGYHGTCFAYGMTGSGKSYTMVGAPPLRAGEERTVVGMCHLALRALFDGFSTASTTTRPASRSVLPPQIFATYIELYNERIRDLLVPPSTAGGDADDARQPEIWDDPHGGTTLRHASSIPVGSLAALEVILEQGNVRRTKASTSTNECSSRSHAILQLTIQRAVDNDDDDDRHSPQRWTGSNNDGPLRRFVQSRLTLVDLAGSERAHATSDLQSATATEKVDRRREGANINKSLLALGNCITALGAGRGNNSSTTAHHIPYRDSKLTRLLRDALGGNTKTVMIATISPSCLCFEETLSTLKYATRAASISRTVTCNVAAVVAAPPPAPKQHQQAVAPLPRSMTLYDPPPPLPPQPVRANARRDTNGPEMVIEQPSSSGCRTSWQMSSSTQPQRQEDASTRQHLLMELETKVVDARTQLRVAQVTETKLLSHRTPTERSNVARSLSATARPPSPTRRVDPYGCLDAFRDGQSLPRCANNMPAEGGTVECNTLGARFDGTSLSGGTMHSVRTDQIRRLQNMQFELQQRLALQQRTAMGAAGAGGSISSTAATSGELPMETAENQSAASRSATAATGCPSPPIDRTRSDCGTTAPTSANPKGSGSGGGVRMRSTNEVNTTYVVGSGKKHPHARLADIVAAHWAHEKASGHAKTIDAFLFGNGRH